MTTQAISNYSATHAALTSARETAQGILARKEETRSSNPASTHTVVHHHHYDSWGSWGYSPFWGFYNPRPVVIVDACPIQPSSSRRRDKEDYTWVMIPAAIVGLATSYFMGQNYADYKMAAEKIDQVFENRYSFSTELAQNPELLAKVNEVAARELGILDAKKQEAEIALATKVAMLGASTVAFAGALVTAPALIGLGVAAAAVSGAVMLFQAGSHSSSAEELKAKQLQQTAREAASLLAQIEQPVTAEA